MIDQKHKLSFWETFKSVFWAAFGVQKKAIWKRDLSDGDPLAFATAIILFLVIFIGSISLVVNWVLPS